MEVSLSPRARSVVIWVGVIALGVVLLEAAHALRPFVWAIITAYLLYPVVNAVHRRTRLPRQLISAWLFLMIGLLVTILAINFAPTLVEQVEDLRDLRPNASSDIQRWLEQNQRDNLTRLGLTPQDVSERLDEAGDEITKAVGEAAIPVLFGTFSIAIELIIYFVASFYFIVYGDKFFLAFRGLLHRRFHGEYNRLLREINETLGAYIRGQALLVAIMATASFVVLYTLDVQYALVVAIATGFLELIPLIGPWTAGAIAVSISLFQDTTPFGWTHLTLAIVIALACFALRQLEDVLIIPNVIGRAVHMHPLLVIFVVVVGTSLGGMLGLILAVPIAATVKIIARYFFDKVNAREVRHVERIDNRNDLGALISAFDQRVNWTVVLLIEPGVLTWDDLGLVSKVAEAAADHSVALSAVTPDAVAASLFTAVGVPTSAFALALAGKAEASDPLAALAGVSPG